MRRLGLLLAVGATWLFLAALPALADGGPHVASVNNGSTSLTADSCAGCHRVHTAQAPMLLKEDEEDMCLSCHGAGTGATTDVLTGIQYVPAANGTRTTTELGALRGGGFEFTAIGDPFKYKSATGTWTKVQVDYDATAGTLGQNGVTSAHMDLAGTLGQPGILWGNGANGTGAGPEVSISCGSCHNPHGNGYYRILNKLPTATDTDTTTTPNFSNAWVVNIVDYNVVTGGGAVPFTFRSESSMGVLNGDTISVIDNTAFSPVAPAVHSVVTGTVTMVDGPDVPPGTSENTTPNDNLFTLSGVTNATPGTGGRACRGTWTNLNAGQTPTCTPSGTSVTDDTTTNVAAGVTRNYTVIQTAASAPTLTATAAAAYSPGAGDYFHYRVPWNSTPNNLDAPNGIPGNTTAVPVFAGGFGEQMAAWCTQCHTRYWAWSEPTEDTTDPDGTVGAAYSNARPGDSIFMYQHRTRGASGRGCLTCHVSHGTSAAMTGPNSSTYTFPNGTASDNSRLLKVDNRGTCQQCHDPTGTFATLPVGTQFPPAPYPVPGTP